MQLRVARGRPSAGSRFWGCAVFLASTFCFFFSITAPAQDRSAHTAVTLRADLSATGYAVPSNFVGFSFEVGDLVAGYFTAAQTTLVGLLHMLGAHGHIRFGGNSSDSAPPPALTQDLANSLHAFVTAIGAGWTPIVYGLDGCYYNVSPGDATRIAAAQAGYLAKSFRASNVVFQFGNEPVNYGTGCFTASAYSAMWQATYTAVAGAVSGAKYAAPDDNGAPNAKALVTSLKLPLSTLYAVTQHWYFSGGTPSLPQLLRSVPANTRTPTADLRLPQYFSGVGGVKVAMTEANTISGGGKHGISDVMAAATWYIDLAIALANAGYSWVDTHNRFVTGGNNGNAWYNGIIHEQNGDFRAGPEFYGQYLFSKIEGEVTVNLEAVSGDEANLTAIAAMNETGNANILIVNNDTDRSVAVTPDQSATWRDGSVLLMHGDGCGDPHPIVGGAAIGDGGAWRGSTAAISYGGTVTLGPCEAALVSIQS